MLTFKANILCRQYIIKLLLYSIECYINQYYSSLTEFCPCITSRLSTIKGVLIHDIKEIQKKFYL